MLNLVPAFTFILSIIFRMERLYWRSKISRAKALGTFISISGAFVVTLYKGPPILMKPSSTAPLQLFSSSQLNWMLGGIFLAVEALTGSAWYVAQAYLLKEFSALSTLMFYQTFFSFILNGAYSLIMVKDPSAWNLRIDMGLFAVLYSAVIGVVLCNYLVSWCLLKIGPFHVVIFKPLSIIFAISMGIIFLGDALFLGSLIGSIIIVIGFYAVIWGKAKEEKTIKEDVKVLLLEKNTEDISNSV